MLPSKAFSKTFAQCQRHSDLLRMAPLTCEKLRTLRQQVPNKSLYIDPEKLN